MERRRLGTPGLFEMRGVLEGHGHQMHDVAEEGSLHDE